MGRANASCCSRRVRSGIATPGPKLFGMLGREKSRRLDVRRLGTCSRQVYTLEILGAHLRTIKPFWPFCVRKSLLFERLEHDPVIVLAVHRHAIPHSLPSPFAARSDRAFSPATMNPCIASRAKKFRSALSVKFIHALAACCEGCCGGRRASAPPS